MSRVYGAKKIITAMVLTDVLVTMEEGGHHEGKSNLIYFLVGQYSKSKVYVTKLNGCCTQGRKNIV